MFHGHRVWFCALMIPISRTGFPRPPSRQYVARHSSPKQNGLVRLIASRCFLCDCPTGRSPSPTDSQILRVCQHHRGKRRSCGRGRVLSAFSHAGEGVRRVPRGAARKETLGWGCGCGCPRGPEPHLAGERGKQGWTEGRGPQGQRHRSLSKVAKPQSRQLYKGSTVPRESIFHRGY